MSKAKREETTSQSGHIGWLAVAMLALVAAPALWWLERAGQIPWQPPAAISRGSGTQPSRHLSLVAVGDVMLDRGVGARMQRHGAQHVFAQVTEALADGDLRFCNLESPLSDTGPHAPHACVFRAAPAAAGALTDAGFDLVSIANNHCLDAGRQGLQNTMMTLAGRRIGFVGGAWEAGGPVRSVGLRVNGLRLRFLAFTDIGRGEALVSPQDCASALELVRAASAEADLMFVSVHWGIEYNRRPSEWQRRFAHALIEAGADIVLGHHPHVLQGIEGRDGRLILYSMGNFVFDQRGVERMESAIFHIRYDEGQGFSVRITPVWIPRSTFAPQTCDSPKAANILGRMQRLCGELGTVMRIEGSTGFIEARDDRHK